MTDQVLSGEITRCANCGKRNRVPAAASGVPRCGNCHKPLAWITGSGDATFAEVVERASLPVLVDFWAPWCEPCRMVSPVLAQLATERAGKLKLVKVNVDTAPELQRRFGIQSIPTLMLFRDGHAAARQIGAAPADALREWLSQSLKGIPGA